MLTGRPAKSLMLRAGQGICRYCNSDFPFDGPAALYLIADRNAVKIGIASPHLRRLTDHRRFGWTLAWTVDVDRGDDAYILEQVIISWWRDGLGAQRAYEARDLPQFGFSATAKWEDAPPDRALAKLRALASHLGINLSRTHEAPAAAERPNTVANAVGARAYAAHFAANGEARPPLPWSIPAER